MIPASTPINDSNAVEPAAASSEAKNDGGGQGTPFAALLATLTSRGSEQAQTPQQSQSQQTCAETNGDGEQDATAPKQAGAAPAGRDQGHEHDPAQALAVELAGAQVIAIPAPLTAQPVVAGDAAAATATSAAPLTASGTPTLLELNAQPTTTSDAAAAAKRAQPVDIGAVIAEAEATATEAQTIATAASAAAAASAKGASSAKAGEAEAASVPAGTTAAPAPDVRLAAGAALTAATAAEPAAPAPTAAPAAAAPLSAPANEPSALAASLAAAVEHAAGDTKDAAGDAKNTPGAAISASSASATTGRSTAASDTQPAVRAQTQPAPVPAAPAGGDTAATLENAVSAALAHHRPDESGTTSKGDTSASGATSGHAAGQPAAPAPATATADQIRADGTLTAGLLQPAAAAKNEVASQSAVTLAQLPEEITHHIVSLSQSGGGEVQVRLDPPGLGGISVQVSLHDGAVQAQITADNSDVARSLQSSLGDLTRSLEQRGISLGQFNVSAQTDSGARRHDPEGDGARRRAARAPRAQKVGESTLKKQDSSPTLSLIDLTL